MSGKNGKALMVLGATSDAGKSVAVLAICRMLRDRGFSVSPFKSQNMSLNAMPTAEGHEISMIQTLQCMAAGVEPTHHVNPILLKPIGDMRSQVVVEGRVFGVYDVDGYYNEFIPEHSMHILKRNINHLLAHNDYVIMEGAGSPAEVNIYDKDVANMGAVKVADADCILVVNMEWGGSFAYVLGTIMLIPEDDRSRIKAILYNNYHGDRAVIQSGIDLIEGMTGIPCLGVMPHIEHRLPPEDSESLRGVESIGSGSIRIGVIRLPRMSNFTDLEPFYCEDVTVVFITRPSQIQGCGMIIVPGTKNSLADMMWLRESGIADAIVDVRGRIPIVGICGGYQILGRRMSDPHGMEDPGIAEVAGLGLLDVDTVWPCGGKVLSRDHAILNPTGEEITGYQIHVGRSVSGEASLFTIGSEPEGSMDSEGMVFGTYLHGAFDSPAFRRYLLGLVDGDAVAMPRRDHRDDIEESISAIARSFEENIDMGLFGRITGAIRWR